MGLRADSTEPAWDSLSLPLPLPLPCSLSLSLKDKQTLKNTSTSWGRYKDFKIT